MMNDAISRSAVLECLCKGCNARNNTPCPSCGEPCSDFKEVSNIPALDVVPVVHARWIDESKEFEGFVIHSCRCSECGKNPLYRRDVDYTPTHTEVNFRYDQSDYCPNCGARMGGEPHDRP